MGKLKVAKISSEANSPVGLGIASGRATTGRQRRATTGHRRNMVIHGYSVAPRGADFAADVQCYLMDTYGGLSSELIQSGDMTGDADATADYTSDFSADADSWVENTNGDLTFTGNQDKSGKTDTLKILADAGGDPASFKRAGAITNAVRYKVTFSYFAETGHGCAYWALGMLNDVWDEGFDHDAGNHPAIASNAWTDVTLYGLADGTTLELCAVTTQNGQTEDTLVGTKSIWLHNIQAFPMDTGNDGDWTRSDNTKLYWDWYNGKMDADASGAATATYAGTNNVLKTNAIYRSAATISSYVAGDLWLTAGGVTFADMDANNTYTRHFVATAATALVLNADATGDGDFDTISLKMERQGDQVTPLTLSDSIYNHTIRTALLQPQVVPFPKPIMTDDGWFMYFTTGGASCILDINVFYEYI
jgi:hypothetical protein